MRNYKEMIVKLSNDELEKETTQAVRDRNALMIEYCRQEMEDRHLDFIKAYNRALQTI